MVWIKINCSSKNFGKEWFWNNSFSIILIFNYLSLLNVAWTFSPWDASGKDVEMYPLPQSRWLLENYLTLKLDSLFNLKHTFPIKEQFRSRFLFIVMENFEPHQCAFSDPCVLVWTHIHVNPASISGSLNLSFDSLCQPRVHGLLSFLEVNHKPLGSKDERVQPI